MVTTNVGKVKDSEGKGGQTAHVDYVGGEPSGGAFRVVIGALDVRKLYVSIGLLFVADHY